VHTVKRFALTPRAVEQTTGLLLLMACLSACDKPAQQGSSIAVAATAAPASMTLAAPVPATSAANAALEVAVAREATSRTAREQTLRIQQHLREQQRAREAAPPGHGNERCLAGQRMRRVANGWVQAGKC